jgi:putative FmdB family regulatory protein
MPLYEYQCRDCGEEFEKMARFSEAEQNPPCPQCQGKDTKKKISSFASLGNFLGGSATPAASSCTSRGGFS